MFPDQPGDYSLAKYAEEPVVERKGISFTSSGKFADFFYGRYCDRDIELGPETQAAFWNDKRDIHKTITDIYDYVCGVVAGDPIFRYLWNGQVSEALSRMKKNGVKMRLMTEQERENYGAINCRQRNYIAVRKGIFLVDPEFAQTAWLPSVAGELSHEYFAWLHDTGKLKHQDARPRQKFNLRQRMSQISQKRIHTKDVVFTFFMTAFDYICEGNLERIPEDYLREGGQEKPWFELWQKEDNQEKENSPVLQLKPVAA